MPSRLHLSALLLLAAAIWGVALVVEGVNVKSGWLHPFSTVVGALLLLLTAFDLWLWRWRALHGWFVHRPNARGTWKVELVSSWVDPATNSTKPPREAYLVVRQTYSTLSVRMLTQESGSESLASELHVAADGVVRMASVYRNEPRLSVRDQSPIHHGALLVDILGDPPTGLRGYYWTDRNSRGEISSKGRANKLASSFDDAREMVREAVAKQAREKAAKAAKAAKMDSKESPPKAPSESTSTSSPPAANTSTPSDPQT